VSTSSDWGGTTRSRLQPAGEERRATRTRSLLRRLRRIWGVLDANQRLAVGACVALLLTMFLPWYSQTDTVVVGNAGKSTLASTQHTLSAFQAFSFVEGAVLLVSASVLAMLWARAEGQPFRLPGGDGLIVIAAGVWAALLIVYRTLEEPGPHGTQRVTSSTGVEWGIFLALIAAVVLTAAGSRMRATRKPMPPLLRPRGEEPAPAQFDAEAPVLAGGRPRYPPAPTTPPAAAARAPLAAAPRLRVGRARSAGADRGR
jgi:hypothetical protein